MHLIHYLTMIFKSCLWQELNKILFLFSCVGSECIDKVWNQFLICTVCPCEVNLDISNSRIFQLAKLKGILDLEA